MTIKPLGERILVKPVEVVQKTKSGIVLPDTATKEKPSMSEIIAVGDGENVAKMGDLALFSKSKMIIQPINAEIGLF